MSDEKPPEKPTTRLEAPPAWAQEMARNVAATKSTAENTRDTVGRLSDEIGVMRVDIRSLQQWRLDEERRRETASVPPPAMTSLRIREVIEEHPSKLDLDAQAKLAELETWRQTVATKADLDAQNAVIVTAVKEAFKDPMVRKAVYGLIGLLIAATSYATGYLQDRKPVSHQVAP